MMSEHSGRTDPSPEDTTRLWHDLAGCVEAFVAAWDAAAEPPELAAFLPAGPAALRRLALVELVKVDLERRWLKRRAPRLIEAYLEAHPELVAERFPADLIYEEYHVRKQAGDSVAPQAYFERFPKQAAELGRLLGLEAADRTTSVVRGPRPADVEPGERLDDFDLLTQLGRGAFASVFLARQRSMQRLVALKVSADRGAEPQTLAQLDHANIVRVYDQRDLPERGLHLLYMQYVPGGTLLDAIALARTVPAAERSGRTFLRALDRALEARGDSAPEESALRGRLAVMTWVEVVCWLGAKLAGALAHAHRLGVLHRDVKPANVLLTGDGTPKLADFNVSCCSKLDGAGPAAIFGGSLAYMSPEQLEAFNPAHSRSPDSLDGRSDLYSLGVLLWELLVGRRPFTDEALGDGWQASLDQMLAHRRKGPPPPNRAALPPDDSEGLCDVLMTCLKPDPAERFPSAEALASRLALCLQPRGQRLLNPPPRGWRQAVRRAPIFFVLLAAVAPNVLAAAFNLLYNLYAIAEEMPELTAAFWNTQLFINATAFPLGVGVLAALTWPVARGLKRVRAGEALPPEVARGLRARCLRLGHYAAVLGLAEWVAAGLVYPLVMGSAAAAVYVHFFVSLALCGLLAAAYPFFTITFLCVHALYPAFVRLGQGAAERDGLKQLSRRLLGYLCLTASVPMLGVAVLVLTGSGSRLALGVFSAGGLAGFALVYAAFRELEADLVALRWALCPPRGVLDFTSDAFLPLDSLPRR
jgi:serine/threonine protein kinase